MTGTQRRTLRRLADKAMELALQAHHAAEDLDPETDRAAQDAARAAVHQLEDVRGNLAEAAGDA